MNKKIALTVSVLLALMLASTLVSIATAAPVTTSKSISGKGAVAQWYVNTGTDTSPKPFKINVVLSETNSEKNGQIYVSVVHSLGASPTTIVSTAPATFSWYQDQITVTTTLTFPWHGTPTPHTLVITWQTNGPTSHQQITSDSQHGMTTKITDAGWKSGSATIVIDPDASSGAHVATTLATNYAYIVHGDATASITTP